MASDVRPMLGWAAAVMTGVQLVGVVFAVALCSTYEVENVPQLATASSWAMSFRTTTSMQPPEMVGSTALGLRMRAQVAPLSVDCMMPVAVAAYRSVGFAPLTATRLTYWKFVSPVVVMC